jgi:predicted O-methyltransferase YrrM
LLEDLRASFPWPKTKPVGHSEVRGWFLPLARKALAEPARRAEVILELGSYHGESTRWFCDNSDATVIAVDHWKGSPDMFRLTEFHPGREQVIERAEELGLLWETFCEQSWEYRHRIIPLRMTTMDGMWRVFNAQVQPDLIFLDASHQFRETVNEIKLSLDLFPGAEVYGDDIDWESVQDAITEVQKTRDIDVWNNGRVWWIRK